MKTPASILLTVLVATSLAAEPMTPHPMFGFVGLAYGQTARFNIFQGPQPHLRTGETCAGVIRLRFYDERGNVVGERTARLSPTAVESVEFTPLREGGRAHVRPEASWLEYPPGPCRGTLIGGFEMYNNANGETQFALPAVIFEFQEVDQKN